MKAAFTLIPSESKRLIAKAVVQMPEVKAALEKAYVIIPAGTTNAFVVEELLGQQIEKARYAAGLNTHRLLCVTNDADRVGIPTILYKGQIIETTMREALDDFHPETVVIKGANAIDPEGNVGIITAGYDGGTVGASIGTITSQGLSYIVPVGLEKLVPSVREAASFTGAKTFDYTMGADFGMYCVSSRTKVVTEVEALKILFDVGAKHIASGGIGGSEGAVVLAMMGGEHNVKEAIAFVEGIKGEEPVAALKGTCETCPYACCFAGTKEADLPTWLQSS